MRAGYDCSGYTGGGAAPARQELMVGRQSWLRLPTGCGGVGATGVGEHWSKPKSPASTVGWEPFWRGACQGGQVAQGWFTEENQGRVTGASKTVCQTWHPSTLPFPEKVPT